MTVDMDRYHDSSPLSELPDKGYVHLYIGMGKGKTTAALGLSLRAAGYGLKTYIGQFMKGIRYGEFLASDMLPWLTVERYGEDTMVHPDAPREEDMQRLRDGVEKLLAAMACGDYDLVVADELLTACAFSMISEKEVLDLLDKKPDKVELILTGMSASQILVDKADVVTRMEEVRHYYRNQGILSRKGIDR